MACVRCRGLMVCEGRMGERYLRCVICGHHIFEEILTHRDGRMRSVQHETRKLLNYRDRAAKLTVRRVHQIKILLQQRRFTQAQIASRYHVSESCISFIATGRTWKNMQESHKEVAA